MVATRAIDPRLSTIRQSEDVSIRRPGFTVADGEANELLHDNVG